MPKKSSYRVIFATGEDEEHPASELEVQGPNTRGWQSPRFCEYPQEIVLEFNDIMQFSQVQFLSHHSKIAKRIDLHVGGSVKDQEKSLSSGKPLMWTDCKFNRLGHMTLDSNERTNYEARELKSVHIESIGKYLKLTVHECYLNSLNLFNQVGLIAVNILGEVAGEGGKGQDAKQGNEREIRPVRPNKNKAEISPMDDLLFQINFDPTTAQLIRELELRKEHAVGSEDYDEATRCKMAIEHMKKVGRVIADLEGQKTQAVEDEDYTKAKGIKVKIDEMRAQAMAHLTGNVMAPPAAAAAVQERPIKPAKTPEEHPNTMEDQPIRPMSSEDKPIKLADRKKPVDDMSAGDDIPIRPMGKEKLEMMDEYPPGGGPPADFNKNPAPQRGERPIKPMSANAEAMEEIPIRPMGKSKKEDPTGGIVDKKKDAPLPEPEELSEEGKKEPAALTEAFGEYIVKCLFSKNWNLRIHALSEVESKLRGRGSPSSPSSFATAVFRVLKKTISDKNANIYMASCDLVIKSVDALVDLNISSGEIRSGLEPLIPHVVTHAGDVNTRARELSEQCIMALCKHKGVDSPPICDEVTKAVKPNAAWRIVLGRLTLLKILIPELKIGKNGMDLTDIMMFISSALQHSNGQVRTAALEVIKIVYAHVGSKMEAHLVDVKPATMQLVKGAIEGVEVVSEKPATKPPTSQPPKKGAGGGGKKTAKPTAARKSPTRRPATPENEEEEEEEIVPMTQTKKKTEPGRDINININIAPNSAADGFNSALASIAAGTGTTGTEAGEEGSGQCEFCGLEDPSFTSEEKLYVHFWKSCPMLMSCDKCSQIVEIPFANEHLLAECDNKDQMKECPRCHEAVPQTQYKKHMAAKSSAGDPSQVQRCILCHTDITAGPGDEGWKAHLMEGSGCPMNDRTNDVTQAPAPKGGRGQGKSQPASRIPRPGAGRGK